MTATAPFHRLRNRARLTEASSSISGGAGIYTRGVWPRASGPTPAPTEGLGSRGAGRTGLPQGKAFAGQVTGFGVFFLSQKVTHAKCHMSQRARSRVPWSWEHRAVVPAGVPAPPSFLPAAAPVIPALSLQDQTAGAPPSELGSGASASFDQVTAHKPSVQPVHRSDSQCGPQTPWDSVTWGLC